MNLSNKDNFEKFFDMVEGKISNIDSFETLPYDIRNLVLSYYENYIGKIDILVKSKFFTLIKYCLQGKSLEEAINYKTDIDSKFLNSSDKKNIMLMNEQEGKILMEIYNKFKNNNSEWGIFKHNIKKYPI